MALFNTIQNNTNKPKPSGIRNFVSSWMNRNDSMYNRMKSGNMSGKKTPVMPSAPTYPTPSGQPIPNNQTQASTTPSNISSTTPAFKSPAAQQYLSSQLPQSPTQSMQVSSTAMTPPGGSITPPEPSEPVKTPKDKYLEFLNSDKVKQAGENVDEFNKRTSEEIARNRKAEEGIEANEIGALQSGVNYRLGEEARKSNKSLADIALAKGYASDIYQRMLDEGRTQYEAEQEAYKAVEEANQPLSIEEATQLGVPYGTTYAGAAKMGITPRSASGGFSLSEGEARYDAQGNLIASRAKSGGVGGSDNAAYDNLSSPQKTKVDSINIVAGQLQNYRNLVDTLTKGGGGNLTGSDAAQLRAAKAGLEFAIAQAVGTGALQAADRAVVMDMLPNPTSLLGAIGGRIRGGKAGNLSALDQIKGVFDAARDSVLYGTAVAPGTSPVSSGGGNNPLSI